MDELEMLEQIPEPKTRVQYLCPTCGCAFHSVHSYIEHYKEHIRTGLPFVVSIELPPIEEFEDD